MRIALNGWFWDQPHTGSGQYLCALAEYLPEAAPEHEYIIVVPPHISGFTSHASRITHHVSSRTAFRPVHVGGVTLHVAPSPISRSNLGKVIFEQLTFPQSCRVLHADLAHVPYWAPPLRSPVPIVVTVHDLIPLILPEYRGSLVARLYTALVSAATTGAAFVIADSESSRADVLAHLGLPSAKVRAIHLAAGPEYRPSNSFDLDPALKEKYSLPDSYVLYLGGFDPRKNVGTLIAAWTWAADSIGEAYPLVIAGRLPPRSDAFFADYPAQAAGLKIAEGVRFIGHVDEADKPGLYRGAACFVFPSRYEGFGLPVLEAMACGTPVISTSAGSLAEIAGDAAYLVSPDDARSIGAAIIATIVQENLADDLREKGLAQAAKFSWEKTARETVNVYEEGMGKRETKGNKGN